MSTFAFILVFKAISESQLLKLNIMKAGEATNELILMRIEMNLALFTLESSRVNDISRMHKRNMHA